MRNTDIALGVLAQVTLASWDRLIDGSNIMEERLALAQCFRKFQSTMARRAWWNSSVHGCGNIRQRLLCINTTATNPFLVVAYDLPSGTKVSGSVWGSVAARTGHK